MLWVSLELLMAIMAVGCLVATFFVVGYLRDLLYRPTALSDTAGVNKLPDTDGPITRAEFISILDYYEFTSRETVLLCLQFMGHYNAEICLRNLLNNIDHENISTMTTFSSSVTITSVLTKWEGPLEAIHKEYVTIRDSGDTTPPLDLLQEIILSKQPYYSMELL